MVRCEPQYLAVVASRLALFAKKEVGVGLIVLQVQKRLQHSYSVVPPPLLVHRSQQSSSRKRGFRCHGGSLPPLPPLHRNTVPRIADIRYSQGQGESLCPQTGGTRHQAARYNCGALRGAPGDSSARLVSSSGTCLILVAALNRSLCWPGSWAAGSKKRGLVIVLHASSPAAFLSFPGDTLCITTDGDQGARITDRSSGGIGYGAPGKMGCTRRAPEEHLH